VPPIIMGHEAAGVIAEVGKEVKDWKKGDRVTFDSNDFLWLVLVLPARVDKPVR